MSRNYVGELFDLSEMGMVPRFLCTMEMQSLQRHGGFPRRIQSQLDDEHEKDHSPNFNSTCR